MKNKNIVALAFGLIYVSSLSAAPPPRLLNRQAIMQNRETPVDALRRGERAMTAIDLQIAPDGSVVNCKIAYSSKSALLDEYACTLYKDHARFEPSIASQRNAIRTLRDFLNWEASKNAPDAQTSKASPAIPGSGNARWVTTDDLPQGILAKDEIVTSNVLLKISAKGKITSCSVTLPSEKPDLDARVCALLSARAHYRPARDARGIQTDGVDWVGIRWQVPID